MNAAPEFRPDPLDLLEDAARRITQPGWEILAADAIEAAKKRLAELSDTDNLEVSLHLAAGLIAGRFTVGPALAIIDALPGFDPLDRDRPDEPQYRRRGVQQLALEGWFR